MRYTLSHALRMPKSPFAPSRIATTINSYLATNSKQPPPFPKPTPRRPSPTTPNHHQVCYWAWLVLETEEIKDQKSREIESLEGEVRLLDEGKKSHLPKS
jgi:hypothetical protein